MKKQILILSALVVIASASFAFVNKSNTKPTVDKDQRTSSAPIGGLGVVDQL